MKKVLILEDEVSIRSFVVINLKRAGYEVVEAGTGEEALELLKANPDVGVAILDIMLPGIDGFEVCRSIRVTDKKIGIIMLTARSQEMDKITGLMTGADDYMTKPFSPAELTARIDASIAHEGSFVVIRMRDYGPGIPEEELPHVKLKFYKGSSKARGSGIGLAVCEEIVTMHGGTLTLENAEGGGTLVTISIPTGEE